MNRLPESVARLCDDGSFERVSVRRLLVGDRVRILPGEMFPADGLVLMGQTSVDEALLTGESRPVSRAVGDEVIAGSHNLTAGVEVRVLRVGEQTRFAQIVALMESASVTKPTLALLADRIAIFNTCFAGGRTSGCFLVGPRPRTCAHGGRFCTGGDLPVCAVIGHAGGYVGRCRSVGTLRRFGASDGSL
jgi:P-type E1-E2 ATPase